MIHLLSIKVIKSFNNSRGIENIYIKEGIFTRPSGGEE
jgi:hypothetical protein